MSSARRERVPSLDAGSRLDVFLARREPGESRSRLARLIGAGGVCVNGRVVPASHRVRDGDEIEWRLPITWIEPTGGPIAESIPLRILHQDSAIIVIDKASGMVVHPAPGHNTGTLVNALVALDPGLRIGDEAWPGIVHRLDRGTSGVIVIARHDRALRNLQAQFAARGVAKRYVALVQGVPRHATATIDAPIGRDPRDRKRMAVVSNGRPSVTRYTVLERFARTSLVECAPETGRTHQIRVHMASIGHPLVGDGVYGTVDERLDRPFLHAAILTFTHPDTGLPVTFTSPLPDDLRRYLEVARGS
ncbi:MAG: RluA family pseudouridine synthase [Chloroflexota bacterium]|nr:MAG: RluA family pseudouridine synthase [Chloroflexota bacterium]